MLDLSIAIVGHNHCKELEKALHSLFDQEHAIEFEVILVDNASTDGTVEMVKSQFPNVNIIYNKERHGFARNGNIGINEAKNGKYLLLLNPDIQCLPGALETLVAFMDRHPDVGIAGPRLLNPDMTLQYSCRQFSRPIVPVLRFLHADQLFPGLSVLRENLMSDWDHNQACAVDYVTGACLILRRQALAEVGQMDEAFFLYCEDQDWCLRMWRNGWKVYYVPDSLMIHDLQRDSTKSLLNQAQRAHIVSLVRLFRKYGLQPKRLAD